MRWLYLPMIFVCLALSWILKNILSYRSKFSYILLMILVLYFGAYTYILNQHLWLNNNTLFEKEVIHFNNVYFAGDFAENLIDKKEYGEAEKYFKIAIKNNPYQVQNYINYSALLIDIGKYNIALSRLEEAKSLTMTSHKRGQWHNNVGLALYKSGRKKEGLKYLHKAVIFAPQEEQFWENLGSVYGMIGDYNQSVEVLEKGLKNIPGANSLLLILAKNYINLKSYKKAVDTLENIKSNQKAINDNAHELLRRAVENMKTVP
jgi:tetratricopeptide (TPR) repeat protein